MSKRSSSRMPPPNSAPRRKHHSRVVGCFAIKSRPLPWGFSPCQTGSTLPSLASNATKLVLYTGGHTGAELNPRGRQTGGVLLADYINVGMEHGVLDLAGLGAFMQGWGESPAPPRAAQASRDRRTPGRGCERSPRPRQRLAGAADSRCGVHGLLLCHAENVDAVSAFVEAARYTFRGGTRGAGAQGKRPVPYGASPADEYLDRADPGP